MSAAGQPIRGKVRHFWEALFSLHLAFLGTSVTFIVSVHVLAPFTRLECRINNFLHIRQTDFIRGYFSVWIASVLAAFLVWVLLRTLGRTRFAEEFLRSVAGITTLFAPLAFWVFVYERSFWPVGWPYRGAPFEIAGALICALLFLSGKWRAPSRAGVLLLAVHYIYWYFAGSSDPAGPDYSGPFGPVLGFCSALAWGQYVGLRAPPPAAPSPTLQLHSRT